MPRDDAEPTRWMQSARMDLRVVRRLLTPDCAEWEAVGFHCQQAIEKALKAVLASRAEEIQKVHDLDHLMDLCVPHAPLLGRFRPTLYSITFYAVMWRYPMPRAPKPDDVRQAARLAEEMVAVIEGWLTGPESDRQPSPPQPDPGVSGGGT